MNNDILYLIQDTETLLNDIFLSGFYSVTNSSLEQLKQLIKNFEQYEMKTGLKLLSEFENELLKYKNSFSGDKQKIAKTFCCLEFYLKNASEILN